MDKVNKIEFVTSIADKLRPVIQSPNVRNWIGCQFALESNFGHSELALSYNNYCGMKSAIIRPTSRDKSIGGDYACYNDIHDCVLDYMLWLAYNRISRHQFDAIYQFRDWLKKSSYCPEKDYVDRIDAIYNQLF